MIKWFAEAWDELVYELKLIWQMFLQANTWIVIGVLSAFCLVVFFGARIAMRYDGLLQMLRVAGGYCRALSNLQYLGLIYLMFFFAMAVIYCLGNLINYLTDRRNSKYAKENRRLMIHAVLGGLAAVGIGALATGMLAYWC